MAMKMNGSINNVVEALAKIDEDSLESPSDCRMVAPELIKIVGVKYMTAFTPHACINRSKYHIERKESNL